MNNTTQNVMDNEKVLLDANHRFYCKTCDIFCNSALQYKIHNISAKHAQNEQIRQKADSIEAEYKTTTEIKDSDLAQTCDIDVSLYNIPADKKSGKYKRFGYYCSCCNIYMTGQIQLIMHVKGTRHQTLSQSIKMKRVNRDERVVSPMSQISEADEQCVPEMQEAPVEQIQNNTTVPMIESPQTSMNLQLAHEPKYMVQYVDTGLVQTQQQVIMTPVPTVINYIVYNPVYYVYMNH